MSSKHKGRIVIGMLIALLATVGGTGVSLAEGPAKAWSCLQNGLVREVTIYYPNEPARLPCEVYYSKRHENRLPRPLWTATNEEGYCERKAESFVEKLESLGWQCQADEPPASAGN